MKKTITIYEKKCGEILFHGETNKTIKSAIRQVTTQVSNDVYQKIIRGGTEARNEMRNIININFL